MNSFHFDKTFLKCQNNEKFNQGFKNLILLIKDTLDID